MDILIIREMASKRSPISDIDVSAYMRLGGGMSDVQHVDAS